MRLPARDRGFTLIELMVTVAIVGVLATIAVVIYRKKVSSTKTTEAKMMVGAIREAQERYKSEKGTYADVSSGLTTTSLYPATPAATQVTAWGGACSVCNQGYDWRDLNLHPTEPMRFGYATVADQASMTPSAKGVSLTANGSAVTFPTPTAPWYVVVAYGAPYDANQWAECEVIGSSWTNDLTVVDLCF